MKTIQDYKTVLRPDDNGTFVAYVPGIPGCHAWGETSEQAQSELVHAFEMIRDEYLESGKDLPQDVELVIANASESQRVGKGSSKTRVFKTRQKGSHARLQHIDGRATTIPIHGNAEIGGWLFKEILKQLDITEQEFNRLR